MKRFFLTVGIFLMLASVASSQSVGLVLSGGGAKGAAHIGYIKALEEKGIPIDYVGGTSIGAIVGSMYAMGYSPEEMLDLFMSKEFYYWQTGKVEENYFYYFREKDPTPEFTHFTINIKDSIKLNAIQFPSSLVNPIQMNQAFMALFGPATAYCKGNFDYLFVPFLCVASDIFEKKPVIFRSGDLGDAVRASMTFPFVFTPITKDSVPLYDGGIYDNFPIRPVKKAFDPDYIIGSAVVGNKRKKPIEQGIYEQVENMIMQPIIRYMPENEGYIEKFRLDDVSLLDFQKAKELYEIGYKQGILAADTIKQRVLRTVPEEELSARRKAFRRELPPLRFKNIAINGVSEAQKLYIENQFHQNTDEYFSMEDFKKAYFKLLADSKIRSIIPHAIYNEQEKCFDLRLDVTINNEIIVAFGGNVSSSNANQLYLGLGYQSLGQYAMDTNLDMQVGNAFNGVQLTGRVELPSQVPVYVKGIGSYTYRKYFESEKLFLEDELTTFLQQEEAYFKLRVGFPFLTKAKSEITVGYGSLRDHYYQSNDVVFSETGFDRSTNNLFLASLAIKKNTLGAKQYPITGQEHILMAQLLSGSENYEAADLKSRMPKQSYYQSWLQINAKLHNYHSFAPKFNFGYLFEGILSSKNLLSNYTESIIQAPAFTPTPHSKLVFNESFRANEYIAGGIIPILKLSDIFHFRADIYGFAPIYPILKDNQNQPYYGNLFTKFEYMAELSAVLQFPFASISFYGNYYSSPKDNWNFGLNIGFLIFSPKFIE